MPKMKLNTWKIIDLCIICSAAFLFLAAASIATDMTGITNFETNNLTAGAVDGTIPKAAAMIFTSSCPTGWTQLSASTNRFPLGASSYGSTGGSSTHSHTASSHSHSAGSLQLDSGGSHTHTQPSTIVSNTHSSHQHGQPGGSATNSGGATAGACAGGTTTCSGNCFSSNDDHPASRSGTSTGAGTHSHTFSGNSASATAAMTSETSDYTYRDMVLCQRN